MTQIQHAYPGYGMERAFLERAVREQHVDVIPELALGSWRRRRSMPSRHNPCVSW
jgi:hypothetical protein